MLKSKFLPDQEVLERIKSNDRTILGEIFIRYERMILSYITSHGGSKIDAEDILQESIIVLWQKVNSGNFELTAKLSTFIMGIAKNKWMVELRKQKRDSSVEMLENRSSGNPTILDELISDEKMEIIRAALNALQPICKKLLILYYFEERRMEEISKILNFANTDVVKSKKYQCKKALEQILQERAAEIGGKI